ncbi:MAG: HAD family hydrolase [Bacteroidota bacterium]
MAEIVNIVFDLGQVLLPIDFNAPVHAFKNLGLSDFDNLYHQSLQADLFDSLETGRISEAEFRREMRRISGEAWTDEQIDQAWSTIILDFRPETMDMLVQLRKQYPLFLLSNTNSIHYSVYDAQVRRRFNKKGLSAYFDKAYYSHEMGLRKPDPEIFRRMAADARIKPEESLFVDDNADNIRIAGELGFNVLHHQPENKVEEQIRSILR